MLLLVLDSHSWFAHDCNQSHHSSSKSWLSHRLSNAIHGSNLFSRKNNERLQLHRQQHVLFAVPFLKLMRTKSRTFLRFLSTSLFCLYFAQFPLTMHNRTSDREIRNVDLKTRSRWCADPGLSVVHVISLGAVSTQRPSPFRTGNSNPIVEMQTRRLCNGFAAQDLFLRTGGYLTYIAQCWARVFQKN